MKKKDDKLRETLLYAARTLAREQGLQKLNIRSIAKKAGVASGTVYNYFSGKDEILLALTKEHWKQALLEMDQAIVTDSFCEALSEMYAYLKQTIRQSAGAFMNSLNGVQQKGQESMASAQQELKEILLRRLGQDPYLSDRVWNDDFTREQFAEFVRMNLTGLLKAKDTQMEFFIIVVRRILYPDLDVENKKDG